MLYMDRRIEIKVNKETYEKLEELTEKFSGDYPSKSQAIRSAIHYLHNKRFKDEVFKSELL